MEIQCPNCNKIFNLDKKLIPENGRLLQCGSCDNKWFFKPKVKDIKKVISNENYENDIINTYDEKEEKFERVKNEEDNNTLSPNKNIELNEQVKSVIIDKHDKIINIVKINYIKLLIVALISFVALILVLDTFKDALTALFPNIKFLLNNLYETLKDLFLFFNDLVK